MSHDRDVSGDLHRFAGTVAHELRTPLMAVACEVELALRRNRSGDDYREALRHIAAGISVLVEITGDLSLLSDPVDADPRISASAPLAAILAPIHARYAARADVRIAIDGAADVRVSGDGQRVGRAIALVIEHAIRYRRSGTSVSLHTRVEDGRVGIVIAASPSGFWPNAWSYLHARVTDAASPLQLRVARRILEDSGGALRAVTTAGAEVVEIELHASG
jgi:two-component system OmpR family sensor kinase